LLLRQRNPDSIRTCVVFRGIGGARKNLFWLNDEQWERIEPYLRLPPKVHAALNAQEPQYPPSMRPEIKEAAAWRAFHAALLTDPDATWEEEAK
jgi:hypothetical protein